MKERKVDRRIQRTKKSIHTAFMKLLSEKEFNKITVKNIADAANVDRKTFYNYYKGIYDIRNEVESELLAIFRQSLEELNVSRYVDDPIRIFDILSDLLNKNIEIYGYLMKINGNSQIIRKLADILTEKVAIGIQKLPDLQCDATLCAEFITSGMLNVYQRWFNSDRKTPLSDVSKEVGNLVFYGLNAFRKTDE